MESRTHDQDRRIGRARNRIHLLRPSPAGNSMSTTNGKRQPSRHLRGYGSTHDARRRQVKPLVEAGNAVCSRCGNPISPREQWHLDHTDDRRATSASPTPTATSEPQASRRRNSATKQHPHLTHLVANGLNKRVFLAQTARYPDLRRP